MVGHKVYLTPNATLKKDLQQFYGVVALGMKLEKIYRKKTCLVKGLKESCRIHYWSRCVLQRRRPLQNCTRWLGLNYCHVDRQKPSRSNWQGLA